MKECSVAAIFKHWDFGKFVFSKKCEKNKLTGIKNQNSWPNYIPSHWGSYQQIMAFIMARPLLSVSTGLSQTSWQWLNGQRSRGKNLDASEPVGRPFVLNKRGRLCCAWPCSLVYSGLSCLLSFLLFFLFIFPHLIAPLFHCPVASKVLIFSTCCRTIKRNYKTVRCGKQSSVRVAAVARGHYGGPC